MWRGIAFALAFAAVFAPAYDGPSKASQPPSRRELVTRVLLPTFDAATLNDAGGRSVWGRRMRSADRRHPGPVSALPGIHPSSPRGSSVRLAFARAGLATRSSLGGRTTRAPPPLQLL